MRGTVGKRGTGPAQARKANGTTFGSVSIQDQDVTRYLTMTVDCEEGVGGGTSKAQVVRIVWFLVDQYCLLRLLPQLVPPDAVRSFGIGRLQGPTPPHDCSLSVPGRGTEASSHAQDREGRRNKQDWRGKACEQVGARNRKLTTSVTRSFRHRRKYKQGLGRTLYC